MTSPKLQPTILPSFFADFLTWSYPVLALLVLFGIRLGTGPETPAVPPTPPPLEETPNVEPEKPYPVTPATTKTVTKTTAPTQKVTPPTNRTPPRVATKTNDVFNNGDVSLIVLETRRFRTAESQWSRAFEQVVSQVSKTRKLGTPPIRIVGKTRMLATKLDGRLPDEVDPFENGDWAGMLRRAIALSPSLATKQYWLIDTDVGPPETAISLPSLPPGVDVVIMWTGYKGDATQLSGFTIATPPRRLLFRIESSEVDSYVTESLIRNLK